MESPDAPRIKEIESYAQSKLDGISVIILQDCSKPFVSDITAFVEEYGSVSEEFPLGNVFWTASNIFSLR